MGKFLSILSIAAGFLSGCATFKPIREYSSASTATVASVASVSADFHASCFRCNRYKPLANADSCLRQKRVSREIAHLSEVLGSYCAALGKLASDSLLDDASDMSGWTAAIEKFDGVDSGTVKGASKVAGFLAKAASNRYQARELARFIEESDTSVARLSQGLAKLLDTFYVRELDLESSALLDEFRFAEAQKRSLDRVAWSAYANSQWEAIDALDRKRQAARSLAESLRKLAETHHQLVSIARLEPSKPSEIVTRFVRSSRATVRTVHSTFDR